MLFGYIICMGYGYKKYKLETFYNEDDVSYYLLGAFITDGNVEKHNKRECSILSNDEDWLLSMQSYISDNNLIYRNKIKNDVKTYPVMRVYSKEICSWLITHNCIPKKSLIVK